MREKPEYADYDSARKFEAILGITGTHLVAHPNAICSYSGGSDSDIMIDILETARKFFGLKPIQYAFFNTGLEMAATIRHVKDVEERYGVTIKEYRPKVNIVQATRKYGQPFIYKILSDEIHRMQRGNVPVSVRDEYNGAEDKTAKFAELIERYPTSKQVLRYLCGCDAQGVPLRRKTQMCIDSQPLLKEFIENNPIPFKVSNQCCQKCKKELAHSAQSNAEMIITGERKAEGGARALDASGNGASCFHEQANGKFRFRPLYYVSDKDKDWYKAEHNIKYSDAYEIYGLKRTGCCGCPISYRAVDDLKLIEPFEPNVVKAAWSIFGDSYRYRAEYNRFKKVVRRNANQIEVQMMFGVEFDLPTGDE